MRALVAALAVALVPLASVASAVTGAAPAHAAGNGVTEYPIPTASSFPEGIATGPDGALWFTESSTNKIGRIDPATGVVTEFAVPTASSRPFRITAGPDGNLWFTENSASQIGRITPAGVITEFSGLAAKSGPVAITTGSDKNLWFTEAGKIGRITPTGTITEFTVPVTGTPQSIAAGPDGALWFTDGVLIGRITIGGTVTTFNPPLTIDGPSNPSGITLGPDNNLWFTASNSSRIGRLTPAGQFTLYKISSPFAGPASITTGPDGNLWFAETGRDQIGEFNPTSGGFTEFALPTPNAGPTGITAGPPADGRLWFTEAFADKIGAIPTTATPIAGINSVSPHDGPQAGGTSVTLTGSGFTGAKAVTFGLPGPRGTYASVTPASSFTVNSDTQVTAVVPALAPGRYDVTATASGGTQLAAFGQYVSLAPLAVTAISPASGEPNGGNLVTITGTGLTSATAVDFGTTPADFTVDADTQITAISPPGADGTSAHITVTAAQGTSTPGAADLFTFKFVPVTVTSVNPNQGSPGDPTRPGLSATVTITGTGFVKVTAVNFGSKPAKSFTVNSATQITAVSPIAPINPATGLPQDNLTVDVTVSATEGTSSAVPADEFTFSAKPILQFFITPANAPAAGGTVVKIAGYQLAGTTSVSFGTETVTCPANCWVQSPTEVDVTTPPHPIGGVTVTVTNADGTSLAGLPFAFTGIGTVTGTGSCEAMASTCAEYGAVLLPSGKVLGVGPTGAFDQAQANLYDPVTGTWAAGAVCACGFGGVLTVLPSGKALFIGGSFQNGSRLATAFIYDPTIDSWAATGGPPIFFGFSTATLLPTGKVLITTDQNFADVALPAFGKATELYDPVTNRFAATGLMQHEHLNVPAILLSNGKVLIEGDGGNGTQAPLSNFAETYDPATGTWTAVAPMNQPRFAHTATLLPDGRVLVAGGQITFQTNLASAEIYDPIANTWQVVANMTFAREGHAATLLPNSTVLVVGGDEPIAINSGNPSGNNPSVGEVYDPKSNTWTPTPPTVFLQAHPGFGQQNTAWTVPLSVGPAATCGTNCGKVLIVRGTNSGGLAIPAFPTDVLYTPSTAPAGPAVTLAPVSLTFGPQAVGAPTAAQTVTVTNSGSAALSITSVAPSGANAAEFATTADTCTGVSVGPGATCTVGVTFTPTAAGAASASLAIADNASTSPQSVTLSGTTPGPAVVLSPVGVTFGPQAVGTTTAAQTVTLTNSGSSALTVSAVARNGANAAEFATTADTCTGATVAPGATCTVGVTFTPDAAGSASATLSFTDNAPGSPQSVSLAGTTAGAGTATLSSAGASFGPQAVGSSTATQTVTLTNTGTGPLSITSVAPTGANASEFAIGSNTCTGATLAPGATCSVGITFTPTTAGTASANLAFTDNAPNSPQIVALSGTAVGTKLAASSGPSVTRLAGADRIATAIATSQADFPTAGSAQGVVLSRDDLYPDALAGVPLAAAKSAPLLLTQTSTLNPATQAEIIRALPAGGTVYLLGGTDALNPSVDTALQALGFKTVRLAGTDRFATAVAIASALGDPPAVIEVTGVNFPDAVSAGPAAVVGNAAILLTNGATQAPATGAYLSAHPNDKRTAVGGPAAAADPGAFPVVGADRFATSALVAGFFPAPTVVGLATGLNFPDALSAGPMLGAKGAPILLVNTSAPLPPSIAAYLSAHAQTITSIVVFGGTAAVGPDVVTAATVAATP